MAAAFPDYDFPSVTRNQVQVESPDPIAIGPLTRFLEERDIQVTEARRHLPSLEDVFVQVTGIEAGMMMREKEKAGGGGSQ